MVVFFAAYRLVNGKEALAKVMSGDIMVIGGRGIKEMVTCAVHKPDSVLGHMDYRQLSPTPRYACRTAE
jgi:hypothetical protein